MSNKGFQCSFCKKVYKDKRSISQHEPHCKDNPHYVAKTYACKYCKQEFDNRNKLGQHVRFCIKNPEYQSNLDNAKVNFASRTPHSEETRKKISEARKKYIAEGGKILNGRAIEYRGIRYKSSWELIFAMYCYLAGINFKYESQKASSYKTWTSDFEIDGELYEVGWHDHVDSIQAFQAEGWICHLFKAQEIALMRDFLPRDLVEQYCLPVPNIKNNKTNIKANIPTMDEARKIAEFALGRTLKAKEIVWFKDNDFHNLEPENIMVFQSSADCKTFRNNYKNKKFLIVQEPEGTYTCQKLNGPNNKPLSAPTKQTLAQEVWQMPIVHLAEKYGVYPRDVRAWIKEYGIDKPERSYWQNKVSKEIFPWPEKQEMQRLIDSMSVKKVAEYLSQQAGQQISDNGVRKHCKKQGIELKKRGHFARRENMDNPPFSKEVMSLWVEEGRTCVEIAREVGMSEETVADWFAFFGLKAKNMRRSL